MTLYLLPRPHWKEYMAFQCSIYVVDDTGRIAWSIVGCLSRRPNQDPHSRPKTSGLVAAKVQHWSSDAEHIPPRSATLWPHPSPSGSASSALDRRRSRCSSGSYTPVEMSVHLLPPVKMPHAYSTAPS